MHFGDNNTANKILQSYTPQECKRLSHQIHGVDNDKWRSDGFELCLKAVQAKFHQNMDLWAMLKTTEPKMLVEASTNRLWGTGISIRDTHVLDNKKWHGRGWLSDMLHIVRDEYQKT